jgi:hypothetical protein
VQSGGDSRPVTRTSAAEGQTPYPPSPLPFLSFFDTKTVPGTNLTYQAVKPAFHSALGSALIGWNVGQVALSGIAPPPVVEMVKTETAALTPHIMKTPTDIGTAATWVRYRGEAGRGVILVPSAGWVPGIGLMDIKAPSMTAIVTEDAALLAKYAQSGMPGFVMYEPKNGWKTSGLQVPPGTPPPGTDTGSKTNYLLIAGGVAIVGVGLFLITR